MRALALFLGVFSAILVFGQQQPSPFIRCRTFESMQEFRALNPGAQTDAQFEAWLQQKIQQRQTDNQRPMVAYTIPIIFHIIHDGEAVGTGSNLSAAKITSQLTQLNNDFANLSGSTYAGIAANMEIQFCLAQRRPDGSPLAEPGIERIDRNAQSWNAPPYDGLASNSYVDVTIMPNSIWDPYKYFNVWTMSLSGSLLGKATFPTGSTLPGLGAGETDTHAGVFVAYQSVGSTTDAGPFGNSAGLGRTLTHESGHFFGLRHIWGDGDCTATDFCADTPPQDQETTGCPAAGTLNNCTPNVPKMFENYMDYTDDLCVNTLTNDQKTRMQTVMANSPRRVELATSNGCTPPVPNAVSFLTSATATTEAPTVLTCPRYKEVTVSLKAAVAASDNATVTFTKGGTAIDVADYTITPAFVTFTNGDNTTKNITVRINDDATVESAETIILTYTISGSGVVAGTGNQTHTITVTDNDLAPVINNNGSITVFSHNFESGAAGWQTGSFINPAGVNVWAVSANGGAGISGISAHITSNTPTANVLDYDITSESDAVLITPFMTTTGGSNLTLSFKYKSEGELFAGTYFDFGRIMYSLDGSSFVTITDGGGIPYRFQGVSAATTATIPLPAVLNNTTFKLGFRWTNDDVDGTPPPFVIDDIVVSTDATRIESTVSQPVTENVFNNQDVYMKSTADGQLLARIQGASADIGCLTATLSQAGNTRIVVNTNAGSYLRTEKVIQLSPSVANPTVTYQGTLYFTTAELAPWVSAGVPLNTLKILKVTDGTSLASTLNFSNSAIITPTFSDQSASSGYYAYTGNFTGFSQFMLASPTISLPVELLSFEARAVRKSIVLNWSTSQELNNKGFAIERSTDGTSFEKIGWVDGKITTNIRTDYNYTDNFVQPGVIYYYRLRQTDIDERTKLSVTRQAKIDEGGVLLTLTPNPATDQVNLFISGSLTPADVQLFNMQGQLVRKWSQVNAYGAPFKLNISGLTSGVYMLHVQLPAEKLVEKIIVR